MPAARFRVVFSDIGGVLGTNGWDTGVRERLCAHFGLDTQEILGRHRLMFDSFERGFLTFEQYIERVFFSAPRTFTSADVRAFAYAQSIPWPENLRFFGELKRANLIKLGLISNEGEGITQHRVEVFGLREVADFLVMSHCVHLRKPDPEIWQLALNLVQCEPAECVYVDDRELFVECAAGMGFVGIHHTELERTVKEFSELGFKVPPAG